MTDIKIPLDLFLEIEDLISYINLDNFDLVTKLRFENVLSEIDLKKKKMQSREIFIKMKNAEGEEKENLIIKYLQSKSDIKNQG